MSKSRTSKMIMSLLAICMLLITNVFSVSAHEIENNRVIVLNNIEEIELYNGADGTYEARLDDGSHIRVTIKTTNIVDPAISTYYSERNYTVRVQLRRFEGLHGMEKVFKFFG